MHARPSQTSARRLKGAVDPSKPLSNARRELFAQMIAEGEPAQVAYKRAGYTGGDDARWDLRRSPEVDLRVNWLLEERIKEQTRARHRREKKLDDLRTRVLLELERVAFADARDVVQWDRRAKVDADGNVMGFEDVIIPRPSRLLTKDQAAQVKSVATKSGTVKFETHDKIQALEKLAKILGLYQDAPPSSATNNVQVNQVNIGVTSALEAARRLAFALAKAQQAQVLGRPTIAGHADDAGQKG